MKIHARLVLEPAALYFCAELFAEMAG